MPERLTGLTRNQVIPCGIRDKGVTSLSRELGRHIPMAEVKGKLKTHFLTLFGAS